MMSEMCQDTHAILQVDPLVLAMEVPSEVFPLQIFPVPSLFYIYI